MVFFPGRHRTLWDFRHTPAVGEKIVAAHEHGAIIAAVCHGPTALLGVTLANGETLVKGKRVNGFTDAEEAAASLVDVVPFPLESEPRKLGGAFEKNEENFAEYAVRDGQLITGQNPASSARVAELILQALDDNIA